MKCACRTQEVTTVIVFATAYLLTLSNTHCQETDLSRILLKSTARIEVTKSDGPNAGTGFFFNLLYPGQNQSVPLLITCKHLIDGSTGGQIYLSIKKKSSKNGYTVRSVSFGETESGWIAHPDAAIDLVALPLAPLMTKLAKSEEEIDIAPLMPSLLPDKDTLRDISLFNEIKIVGYPIGI